MKADVVLSFHNLVEKTTQQDLVSRNVNKEYLKQNFLPDLTSSKKDGDQRSVLLSCKYNLTVCMYSCVNK